MNFAKFVRVPFYRLHLVATSGGNVLNKSFAESVSTIGHTRSHFTRQEATQMVFSLSEFWLDLLGGFQKRGKKRQINLS